MKFFLRKKVYAAAAAALTLVWVLLYANRYHIYRCLPARDGGELVLSGGVLVDRVAHQPFSGRARLKNGEQTLVLSYDEGRPDGLGVACQDGRIKEIVNWKKGRRDGKFMSFEDGHPHVSGTYRQNAKNGEWIQYDENGRIALSRNYRNDVPEGVARRYYPNGRVYIHMNYHDGIPDGYYVMYAESGEPIVEAFLKNGRFEAVKRYNPNYQLPDRDENGGIVIRGLQNEEEGRNRLLPVVQ